MRRGLLTTGFGWREDSQALSGEQEGVREPTSLGRKWLAPSSIRSLPLPFCSTQMWKELEKHRAGGDGRNDVY